MKILSKYKDYYDYLSGIYGEDPKIILDRRKSENHTFFPELDKDQVWSIYVCGYRVDFVYDQGEFYYLDEIVKKYAPEQKLRSDITSVSIRGYSGRLNRSAYIKIIKDFNNVNELTKCPIILTRGVIAKYKDKVELSTQTYYYPKLVDLQFKKAMAPKEIYLLLSEYLAPKDEVHDTRTNTDKILSSGFDLKTSFRNIK